MRFLKNFFSFLLPLVVVLGTFALYSAIDNIVNDYKKTINSDYSILIISNTPIDKKQIKKESSLTIKTIEVLKRDEIVIDLRTQLSKSSLKLLEKKLPFFYSIFLEEYPTKTQLKKLKIELKNIKNIKKVETFATDHNKVYSLLILTQKIVKIILIFVFIFSFLILSKQVKIWVLEHSRRIEIIQYHGGSIIYAILPIIKVTILSAIISSAIVIFLLTIMSNNLEVILTPEILNILPKVDYLLSDVFFIIILAFFISISSIIIVLFKHKTK
jgi:cell division transport system permease protein